MVVTNFIVKGVSCLFAPVHFAAQTVADTIAVTEGVVIWAVSRGAYDVKTNYERRKKETATDQRVVILSSRIGFNYAKSYLVRSEDKKVNCYSRIFDDYNELSFLKPEKFKKSNELKTEIL